MLSESVVFLCFQSHCEIHKHCQLYTAHMSICWKIYNKYAIRILAPVFLTSKLRECVLTYYISTIIYIFSVFYFVPDSSKKNKFRFISSYSYTREKNINDQSFRDCFITADNAGLIDKGLLAWPSMLCYPTSWHQPSVIWPARYLAHHRLSK